MKLRCNTIVDCPYDEADETYCAKVVFTETYNRYASPNTAATMNNEYVVEKVKPMLLNPKILESHNNFIFSSETG